MAFLYTIILIQVCLVEIFIQNESVFVLNRTIRLLLSTIIIGLLGPLLKKELIIPVLGQILSINVLVTLLFYFIPNSRNYIIAFSGYSKQILPLRSPGLFTGYDISGFYINILLILLLHSNLLKSYPKIKSFAILLTSLTTILVSRFSMLLAFIILLSSFFIYRKSMKKSLRIFIVGLTVSSVFILREFILTLFVSTIPKLSELVPSLSKYNQAAVLNSYSTGTLELLTSDMIYFPTELNSFLFGLAQSPRLTDIGYIHLIFYYGLIGSIIIYCSYFLIILKKNQQKIMYFVLILIFLMHYKIPSISASGVHEIILILSVIYNEKT